MPQKSADLISISAEAWSHEYCAVVLTDTKKWWNLHLRRGENIQGVWKLGAEGKAWVLNKLREKRTNGLFLFKSFLICIYNYCVQIKEGGEMGGLCSAQREHKEFILYFLHMRTRMCNDTLSENFKSLIGSSCGMLWTRWRKIAFCAT
jgi:hypothetical protein